jgi:hypothetical protein
VYYVTEGETGSLLPESGASLDYLAAILNSRVMNWCYRQLYWSAHLAGGYLRVNGTYLATLPIPRFDGLTPARRELAMEIARLARLRIGKGCEAADELETHILALYGLGCAEDAIMRGEEGAVPEVAGFWRV